MQYGNGILAKNPALIAIGFKSYYVVWKRKKSNQKNKNINSLNRTMQYGNSGGSTAPYRPIAV